ncbi:MAG: cation transporter [Methanothrix sp.]|uniref:heavy-metal-associated domain-containing protein n=1 Tax=Methanothrix sp. TaxID=90426 RepID=UPI0025E893AE|nr:heavy-metal-associated domain-containing protein [Methanothrix sp.]MCK9405496.1 cation transporter [Methanothrix sp.]
MADRPALRPSCDPDLRAQRSAILIFRLEGVSSARVDLGQKTACVEYDSAKLSEQDFRRAVEAVGYKVE